jgi:hypothetical protein
VARWDAAPPGASLRPRPALQPEALELLRAEVAGGNASPGNLAHLEDRVDVGQGRPQRHGTQVGAGLDPDVDHLAEMTRVCGGG